MTEPTHRQDCADAFMRAAPYHHELQDIYDYFMPFRRPTAGQLGANGGGATEGASRTDHLFDATGMSAAFNFAGNLVADWMPLNQPFFALEAGPLVPDGDAKKALNEQLQYVTNMAHGVLASGRTHATVHEMAIDLFAGTGFMYLGAGDNRELVRGRAVPPIEMAVDEGPWGDLWHFWWRRTWRGRDISVMWPSGKFDDVMARQMREKPRELIEIVQYTMYDPTARVWILKVWAQSVGKGEPFYTEEHRTNPWVGGRFYKVPGEVFGRGLAHLGLPFVKTANKARELALTAAAFAVMGIFTRRNDASFNPATATFEPLSFWTVGSNGGPLGPTLQRLPIPQDFDVSSIIIAEERKQIREVLLDDDVPDLNDPVRSPTEIAARMKRHSRRYGGVNSRLALEVIVPLVQRTVDIVEKQGLLTVAGADGKPMPTNLNIDQVLTQARIVSPAMATQEADKVQRTVQALQMVQMMLGPQALMLMYKIDELVADISRWSGMDEKYINSKLEIDQLKQIMAQQAQQQQAVETMKAMPEQPEGAGYMNGAI
jgi:Bacteriophage head to tail connecting protein